MVYNYTTPLKSNDNNLFQDTQGRIFLPLPPEKIDMKGEMEIYARFMRHLRMVPNAQAEMKILSAIQFTSDLLNHSDAYVAKVLVDLGLRAPRKSYPEAYLEFVDKASVRNSLQANLMTKQMNALNAHWKKTGEKKSGKTRGQTGAVIQPISVCVEPDYLTET